MSSPYTPNSQTRQQLDELDALLQRMLSLPLSQGESGEVPRPPSDSSIPLPPTRPSFPQPVVRSTSQGAAQPGQPAVQSWRVELPPGMEVAPVPPTSGTGGVPLGTEVLRLDSPLRTMPPPAPPPPMIFGQPPAPLAPAPVMPANTPAPQQSRSAARDDGPPLPVILWPVLALNQIFDGIVCMFGPLGRWLTFGGVRNLMGAAGILMILAAIAWAAAEWYGIELPW